ncbi:major facilitator superfamily domain-containing protein [Roridomyces roridus]|uniref:Major facilitator superfamily domain-containing protein n=1 Tax=Roridomyces roridus TaxID=1738132 RepID=A0AAD7BL97_9AGAR|nr:major facilitator superfamily domain-containing protein [Roridomyces roridus]
MSADLHSLDEKKSVSDVEPVVVDQANGVTRIEALYRVFTGWKIWMLYGSLAVISFVYALSSSTTYTYEAFAASSFESHSLIGAISVATSIIGGVSRPFIAKLADLASRPAALSISVFLYALGYIIVAASKTIGAVAAGQVLYAMGNTGIDLTVTVILADITSLQYRSLFLGLYSMSFVITTFVSGDISTGISANTLNGWRWGYGMFIILVPVSIGPALVTLFWADRKAKRIGAPSLSSSSHSRRQQITGEQAPSRSIIELCVHYARVMDAFGLLLLGTSCSLLLLPFSLYTTAQNGWRNPSLIAMFVVGGILLISFFVWELKMSEHPIMPKRILNRSFVCSVAIDFMYYLSGDLTLTYFSSYVYVVKDWSLKDYTYFSNTLTVGLCFFGFCVGIVHRVTHRYKYLQLTGLGIRIIGQGLIFLASNGNKSDAVLVMSQILTSLGGACSVMGSQVASQASVPHQDLALVISLLSLWTSVGGGIGSAIAAAIWDNQLPKNLDKYVGNTLNATQRAEIFGSITVARDSEPRAEIIKAYDATARAMFLPALVLSCLPLLAGLLTTNFYLGNTQNAVEDKEVRVRGSGTDEEVEGESKTTV